MRFTRKTHRQFRFFFLLTACLLTYLLYAIDVKYVDPKNKKRKKRVFYEKIKYVKKRWKKTLSSKDSKLITPIEKQH